MTTVHITKSLLPAPPPPPPPMPRMPHQAKA